MSNASKIVAMLDIGSNTSLLLIARLSKSQGLKILEDRLFYTRLAEDFTKTNNHINQSSSKSALPCSFAKTNNYKYIKPIALKRQAQFFKTAKTLIHKHFTSGADQQIRCVATEICRQAHNKGEVVALGKQYGFHVEVISPKEEAQLSRVGALFNLSLDPKKAVVLDIGGASTEISSEHQFFSLPIGSVNLTERFLHHNPSTQAEVNELERHIQQAIKQIPFSFSEQAVLVATAGTPTTLANLQNPKNNLDKLHGIKLSFPQVKTWYKNLLCLSVEERKKLQGMPIYRADVLPAGLSLLTQIMLYFHWKECFVSVTGLRYGLLYHPSNTRWMKPNWPK